MTASLGKRCGFYIGVAVAITATASLRAQQTAPASPPSESPQALRTREFLGLGRIPDQKAAAAGEKLFGQNCSFCHGKNARGATGPDLLRSSVVLDDDKGELIGPVVQKGRPGKGMPAFPSFSAEQIHQISEFLHLQVELGANRGTYKLLDVVTGNAEAGKSYFNGEGKCTSCHSITGDLAHIGSKFSPDDLQQKFLYPDAGANSVRVTVVFPDGHTESGTLKHIDDFYVSFYDANGNYRSIPMDKEVRVKIEDKLAFHREMLDKYTDEIMHNLTAYLITLK